MRPGKFRAWRFQTDMVGGRAWRPQLPANIESCDIFLLATTESSLNSETCEKEWQHAALIQKPTVTVVFERGVSPPPPLNDHQWVHFDGSAVSGAHLINALQNSQPVPWEAIPDDWTTWDGRPKSELSSGQFINSEIPLPRIRQDLTDLEKETFLEESIGKIRNYFYQALGEFENSNPRVRTQIRDNTNMRGLSCKVHLDGKLSKRCTIWIHNQYGLNGIAYYETRRHEAIFGNQPYNELAKVAELDGEPALDFSPGLGMFNQFDDCRICTVDKAAECLWKYFTRDIGQDSSLW